MCAKNHRNRYRRLATTHHKPYGPYTPILAILRMYAHYSYGCMLLVGCWLVGHARYCGQMAEVTTDELTIVLKFGLDRPYNGAEP